MATRRARCAGKFVTERRRCGEAGVNGEDALLVAGVLLARGFWSRGHEASGMGTLLQRCPQNPGNPSHWWGCLPGRKSGPPRAAARRNTVPTGVQAVGVGGASRLRSRAAFALQGLDGVRWANGPRVVITCVLARSSSFNPPAVHEARVNRVTRGPKSRRPCERASKPRTR